MRVIIALLDHYFTQLKVNLAAQQSASDEVIVSR